MYVFIKEALAKAPKRKWDPKHLDILAKETATQIKTEYAWRIKKKNEELVTKKSKIHEVRVQEVQDQFEEENEDEEVIHMDWMKLKKKNEKWVHNMLF